MSEFFKSAMGYFNNPSTTNTSSNPNSGGSSNSGPVNANIYKSSTTATPDNEFCGQIVEINAHKLRVKRVIAEGGFAFVYVAQDIQTDKEYALKRLIGADKKACQSIINEINTHKQLTGHPNIVGFASATFIDKTNGPQQRAEYLLLTELCKGGSLIDCLGTTLDPAVILRIFYQAAKAVAHMHSQSPPIVHRDIKIENYLLGDDNKLKLCDFGSATTEIFAPTLDWNAQQRNLLEDQLSSVTTPMYRAPEMLDTWSNYEVGLKVDVWSLGCILYVLCFQKHPFEDSAKLRIVNGNFIIPTDGRFACFHDIIKGCLTVNPAQRFNVSMILDRLAAISETMNWPLRGPLDLIGKAIITTTPEHSYTPSNPASNVAAASASGPTQQRTTAGNSTFYDDSNSSNPTNRSQSPHMSSAQSSSTNPSAAAAANGSLFSSIRGGAGSFLKNLKDTSSKVMQTMQQTIARNDLDISYITSRVLVMPCPSEGFESAYKTNNIEDVRLSIESRFPPQKVSVYNFGPRSCPRLSPPVRTVEAGSIYGCSQARAPNLQGLFSVAEDMYGFLTADPKSTVIIQTGDAGGCTAATLVCALLMYSDLILEPEDAVQVFAVKRHPVNLRPSEFRYLYYLGDILRPTPLLPHYKNINLISLNCQPVPRMSKTRDGCRIYMEVYNNERLLMSTMQDYEKMRLYMAGSGKITLPINLTVCGDLVIVLYHARKGMVRPQGVKICQFQLHTGFLPEQETLITFSGQDLDDLPDAECVPPNFTVSLSITVTDMETPPNRQPPWLPTKPRRNAFHLFSSQLEFEEMIDNFVAKPTSNTPPDTLRKAPQQRPNPPLMNDKAMTPPLIMPDITEITQDNFHIPAEPTPPIDLLNLNQHSAQHQQQARDDRATAMPTTDASFDLLGAFGDDDSSGIGNAPIPDILANNSQPKSAADLDDIFGPLNSNTTPSFNIDFNAFAAPQANASSYTNPKVKSSAPTSTSFGAIPTFTTQTTSKEPSPQQQPKDPFADIANLASGLNINFTPQTTLGGKSAGHTPVGNSPFTTHFSSPTHNQTNTNTNTNSANIRIPPTQPTQSSNSTSPNHRKSPNTSATFGMPFTSAQPSTQFPGAGAATGPPPPTSTQSSRPDYSRSHFDQTKPQAGAGNTAQQPKSSDIFADILGEQGYKFTSKGNQGPRSINEMRKEDLIKDMDPKKVIIMEWTEGKKNNIRALLCSMHTVLWSDAKWSKCDMSQIITATDVKKSYRKACLAVHPDKHNGTDNEEIAKMIFMELNNAWTDFENDATQQNMFN